MTIEKFVPTVSTVSTSSGVTSSPAVNSVPPPSPEPNSDLNPSRELDSVTISEEGRALSEKEEQQRAEENKEERNLKDNELSEADEDLVRQLKARDREVRTHEQAHLSAGGPHVSGPPKYDYQKGPDGRQYAVGGEVQVDTGKVPNDPEATIKKADQIKRAALAPAEPSGKDRQVAAKADRLKSEAQAELREQTQEETGAATETSSPDDSSEDIGIQRSQQNQAPGVQDGSNSIRTYDPRGQANQIDVSGGISLVA